MSDGVPQPLRKSLGSLAAPRQGREGDPSRRVKLESLFQDSSAWRWVANCCVEDSRDLMLVHGARELEGSTLRSYAATGVTIAGASCVPAVLGVLDESDCHNAETRQLWTLRFRMPRSQWDVLSRDGRRPPYVNPGVHTRLLSCAESLGLLRALSPFELPASPTRCVLHPHLVSILIGTYDDMNPEAPLVEIDTDDQGADRCLTDLAADPHIWDGRLLLVAVPPLPVKVEECLTMLTHPEIFAEADDDDDSNDDPDVPISQIIRDHKQWGAFSHAAASVEIAKAFNDQLVHAERWKNEIAVSTLMQKAMRRLSSCFKQTDCANLLTRYCATANSVEVRPAPCSTLAPSAETQPVAANMDPSDDEENDVARPVATTPSTPPHRPNRKRLPDGDAKRAKGNGTVNKKQKKKKPKRGSDTDEDDDDDDDEQSSSSSVSEPSEEEDEDEEECEEDESSGEDDKEETESTANRERQQQQQPQQPQPKPQIPKHKAGQLSAEAAYQLPSHVPDAQRFLNAIGAHRSSFSTTRFEAMEQDIYAITLSERPAPGVAEAAAYNRLLGHAVSCLEDLLEERRPDHCVLMPRAEALAARKATELATRVCETTLPQLDEAIDKLKVLREQTRASLAGGPPAGGAPTNDLPANGLPADGRA